LLRFKVIPEPKDEIVERTLWSSSGEPTRAPSSKYQQFRSREHVSLILYMRDCKTSENENKANLLAALFRRRE
jgi:hypothetical protein